MRILFFYPLAVTAIAGLDPSQKLHMSHSFKYLLHLPFTIPGHQQGAGFEVEYVEHEPALKWVADIADSNFTLYVTISSPNIMF